MSGVEEVLCTLVGQGPPVLHEWCQGEGFDGDLGPVYRSPSTRATAGPLKEFYFRKE